MLRWGRSTRVVACAVAHVFAAQALAVDAFLNSTEEYGTVDTVGVKTSAHHTSDWTYFVRGGGTETIAANDLGVSGERNWYVDWGASPLGGTRFIAGSTITLQASKSSGTATSAGVYGRMGDTVQLNLDGGTQEFQLVASAFSDPAITVQDCGVDLHRDWGLPAGTPVIVAPADGSTGNFVYTGIISAPTPDKNKVISIQTAGSLVSMGPDTSPRIFGASYTLDIWSAPNTLNWTGSGGGPRCQRLSLDRQRELRRVGPCA